MHGVATLVIYTKRSTHADDSIIQKRVQYSYTIKWFFPAVHFPEIHDYNT